MASSLTYTAVLLLAASAVAAGAPLREKQHSPIERVGGGRSLKLIALISAILGREPSGFEVEVGKTLGFEVDDVEGEVELGPFNFKLDPPSEKKDDAGEKKEEKKVEETVCYNYFNTATQSVVCLPIPPTAHGRYYPLGRKMKL